MSLLSDVPKVLHVSHSLASSSEGTPIAIAADSDDITSTGEGNKATHGVLHLSYANAHNGRADELTMHKKVSLVLSRGQVESLTTSGNSWQRPLAVVSGS